MNQFQPFGRNDVHFFHVVGELFLVSDEKNFSIRNFRQSALNRLHDHSGGEITPHGVNRDFHPGKTPLTLPF